MLQIHAQLFLALSNFAGVWETVDATKDRPIEPSEETAAWLLAIEQHCKELGLGTSATAVRRLALAWLNGGVTFGMMSEDYKYFRRVIQDETEARLVFMIDPTRIRYYDGSVPLLSGTVPRKFQAADADFREACKCFALNRYTACVFHLLRVMETPLAVISKQLSIKPVTGQTTWGDYLGKMRPAISRLPLSTPREKRVKEHYDGLEARISAIQKAWRNPTIHRVDRVYDEDEARDLIELVRGLFRTAVKRR